MMMVVVVVVTRRSSAVFLVVAILPPLLSSPGHPADRPSRRRGSLVERCDPLQFHSCALHFTRAALNHAQFDGPDLDLGTRT